MSAKHWELTHRPESDLWTYATAEPAVSLPGIACDICEQWAGSDILPFWANARVQRMIKKMERNIPIQEFFELRKRVATELLCDQSQTETLTPGCGFLPIEVKFKDYPPPLYYVDASALLVREDLVNALLREKTKGIEFHEATVSFSTKIKQPAFKMYVGLVQEMRGIPLGWKLLSKCPHCGREEYDRNGFGEYPSNPDQIMRLRIAPSNLPNADFFHLKTTTMVIVSDKAKSIVESFNFKDAHFVPTLHIEEPA